MVEKTIKPKLFENIPVWICGIVLFVAFFLTLMSYYFPGFAFILKEGGIAPYDIVSPRSDGIINDEKTKEKQQDAENRVPIAYDVNLEIKNQELKRIDELFNICNSVITSHDSSLLTETARAEAIRVDVAKNLKITIKSSVLTELAGANTAQIETVRKGSIDVLATLFDNGINEFEVAQIPNLIQSIVLQMPGSEWTRNLVEEISRSFARQNQFLNDLETNRRKKEARDAVAPVMRTIDEGEIIIKAGDTITAEDISVIKYLGIARNIGDFRTWIGITLLPILLILALYLIAWNAKKIIFSQKTNLFLLALLTIACFTGSRFLVPITPFLAPIPLVAMLITIFFGSEISIPIMLILAPMGALFRGFGPSAVQGTVAIALGVGFAFIGFTTSLKLPAVKRFTHFFIVYLYCIAGTLLASMCFGMFSSLDKYLVLSMVGIALGSTTIQFAIALVSTPLLEYVTSHPTVFRLLELSDLNHPLLRKLLMEAPGTYQHSIMVGNIASIACEEIDANSLLARVGGYYHDIGKLKYPQYFIENQSGYNPHDMLSPENSKDIVVNHVTEGRELGYQFRIPREVTDFIESHHGTSKIGFFYHKAKELDPNTSESSFRYIGSPPKTAEQAVVMLADAVESASRATLPEPTKIEEMVGRLIDDRLHDAQLSLSPISMAQLTKVKQSFIRQLISSSHRRIPYPVETKNG